MIPPFRYNGASLRCSLEQINSNPKSIKAFYSILRNVLTSIVDRDAAFLNKKLGSALRGRD